MCVAAGNEILGSIKIYEFINRLNEYWLLKEGPASWSWKLYGSNKF